MSVQNVNMVSRKGRLFEGQILVGQRHFAAVVCCKSCTGNVVCHSPPGAGMQDLIRVMSILNAVKRASLVFVCDARDCRLRR